MKKIKIILKNILFRAVVGGSMYGGFEILFDNSSDRSMVYLASFCFIVAGELHLACKNMGFRWKCFWIANIVTISEYIIGIIFNADYHIWDYRSMVVFGVPMHINGQICVPFWIVWAIVMAPLAIWLTDKLIDEKVDVLQYYKRLFQK